MKRDEVGKRRKIKERKVGDGAKSCRSLVKKGRDDAVYMMISPYLLSFPTIGKKYKIYQWKFHLKRGNGHKEGEKSKIKGETRKNGKGEGTLRNISSPTKRGNPGTTPQQENKQHPPPRLLVVIPSLGIELSGLTYIQILI